MKTTLHTWILWLSMLVLGSAHGANYTFTDLGAGRAVDINNAGTVLFNNPDDYSFRINAGVREQITNKFVSSVDGVNFDTNYFPGINAIAINDLGHVLSQGYRGQIQPLWLISPGNPAPSGALSMSAWGYDLNSRDEFVGGESVDFYTWGIIGSWDGSPWASYSQVPPLNFSQLQAINDQGVAVGLAAVGNERIRAFKLVGGTVVFIDPRVEPSSISTPFVLSTALAINESGQVVGSMYTAQNVLHAFRDAGNGMEDLGTLGGNQSSANSLNDSGVIVGESTIASGVTNAFLYQDGAMVNLNSLLPAGVTAVFTRALAINNAGQIVGEALIDGVLHGVLMSPSTLPPPPTILSQPQGGGTLATGASLSLSVTAAGALPISYQWQKDGLPIDGQTNSTLALTNVKGYDTGSYRVAVTNPGGTILSDSVAVTVLDPELQSYTFAGFTITGEVAASYRIEFRPKVSTDPWQPLTTITLTNSLQWWVDMSSATNPMRLYRAIRLP